ncbi:MAG: hypothetical protein AABW84_00290 [Nanoarchaeota archaeon]
MVKKRKAKGENTERNSFVAIALVSVVAVVGLLGLFGTGNGVFTGSGAATAAITAVSSDYFLMTLLVLVGIGLTGLYLQNEKVF